MNLTVRTNQDKALFTKLNFSKLTLNVSKIKLLFRDRCQERHLLICINKVKLVEM